MIRTKILLILPLVVAVLGQENSGIGYYGTSNVRDQRPLPQPIYRPRPMLPGRPTVSLHPVVATPLEPVASADPVAAPALPVNIATPPASPTYAPIVLPNPGSRRPLYSSVYRPPLPLRPIIRPVFLPTVALQPAGTVAVVPETPVAAATQPPVAPATQLPVIDAPQPVQVILPVVENIEPPAPESPVLEPESEPARPFRPVPDSIPIESYEPEPVPVSAEELPPAPTLSHQPEEPATPAKIVPGPEIVAEPVPETKPTPKPAPYSVLPLAPEPIEPSVVEAPLPIPQPVLEPESIPKLEPNQEAETIPQTEPVQAIETVPQPELIQKPEISVPQPELSQEEPIREREPLPVVNRPLIPQPSPISPIASVTIAPKPGALPPLLPKPAFGRYPKPSTSPIIYYPTPYVTHSPATPTQAPPVVITTQSHPAVNRPTGTFKMDFQCKEENGYYPVANECDTYIECKQDIAMKHSCPDGLHFNPATKHFEYPCAYPSEVKCTAGAEEQNPNPTEHCPNQYGFYSMNDDDCSKFIMCQEGLATVMDCPMGLVFNTLTSSCDWPANVPQCNPKVFKDFTCPEAPVDDYGQVSDIIYNYRYGQDCKLYVACQRAHPRLLSCDRGLSFDDESQACIDEDYVTDCLVEYQTPVHV